MNVWPKLTPYCLLVSWLVSGCGLMTEGGAKKPLPSNLIATPASYYSTTKARYLGNKYKDNLDRLTERIVRNSTTSHLQFANNISSVGGIGFFTHSATKTPDERYLEVVLATPETFETKGEYSDKVNQLFSRYGQELLSILAGDNEVFQDKELAGYGLNLTWRTVIADAPANRVSLARAIIYFHKERVQNFLRRSVSQNELLGDAVIFAVEDEGPLNLVSYQPREIKPDFRPAIREDNLATGSPAKAPVVPTAAAEGAKPPEEKPGAKGDPIKKDVPLVQAPNPPRVSSQPAAKVESPKVGVQAENTDVASRSLESAKMTAAQPAPAKRDSEPETVTLAKQPLEARSVKPVPETILPKSAPANVTASAPKADRADSSKPSAAAVETVTKLPPVKPASAETTTLKQAEKMSTKPAEPKSIQPQSKQAEETRTPTAPTPTTNPVSPEPTPLREEATKTPEVGAKSSETAEQAELPTLEKKIPISAPMVNKPQERKSAADAAPSAVPLVPNKAPSAPETLVQKPAAIAEKPTVSPRSEIAQPPITKVPVPAGIKAVEPVKAVEEKRIDVATKPESRKYPLDPATSVVAAAPKEASSAPDKPLQKPAAIAEKPVVSPPAEVAPAPIAKMPSGAEVKVVEAVKVFEEKEFEAQNRSKISEPFAAKADAPPTAVAAPEPVVRPSAEKPIESVPARKAESVQPAPVGKAEIRESVKPINAPVVLPNQDKPAAPAPEQLALARKPVEPPSENPLLARPAPKPLHGFIIQVAFADKDKAQSWAQKMTQRGYAVSVTEAGAEGALRVRLGNFSVRDDAERQLQSFKQEGMSGIIINLPQAFRPEARSSLP